MKAAARFFLFIGLVTILLAVWDFTEALSYVELLPDRFATHLMLNLLVWLGIGITEIGVGWLISKETKT